MLTTRTAVAVAYLLIPAPLLATQSPPQQFALRCKYIESPKMAKPFAGVTTKFEVANTAQSKVMTQPVVRTLEGNSASVYSSQPGHLTEFFPSVAKPGVYKLTVKETDTSGKKPKVTFQKTFTLNDKEYVIVTPLAEKSKTRSVSLVVQLEVIGDE